ncbi:MAG: cyclic pyranopterin monophosphate synthase MoaC [Candidatus Omnitrophica bacterium]|nr:cyclic pyranopterin monophosphate synthase MoaC [Candidatus Omnitrophota bacterium]
MKVNLPKMADVSSKSQTRREAVASARVCMKNETLNMLRDDKVPKGDVLACAKIAGIMAAKNTHALLPLCHPLSIDNIDLSFELDVKDSSVKIESRCVSVGKTGVEMEALTAAAIAALTIYDMCKPLEKGITITDIRLIKKSGGKSGDYERKD